MSNNKNRKQYGKTLVMLTAIASIFANAVCTGRIYEPKVPSKLKK